MVPLQEKSPSDVIGNDKSTFDPYKPEHSALIDLPNEIWEPMLQSHCTTEPDMFLRVMRNLIKNPNIMSTHLFRADVLYDSQNDHTIVTEPGHDNFSDFTKHMKQGLRPVYVQVPSYQWQQTYVRQLVPRNRQLDNDLVQSCHFYVRQSGDMTSNLILYVPHVSVSTEMPWYHPKVKQLAFLHESKAFPGQGYTGSVSVHFSLFADFPIDQRLERTALQLLSKIHKHGRGQQSGYVKRGQHDQIVPQQVFQDTYSRLKAKYAKEIIDNWAEKTDPSKHVFEDLGIAAFLIELWADMYDCSNSTKSDHDEDTATDKATSKPKFPGFVDIGCGNGLLISILEKEGYPGWGFDARKRKTWETFSPQVQENVKEMVLVPEVLQTSNDSRPTTQVTDIVENDPQDRAFHNGMFKPVTEHSGTESPFIVSNHADELTPWTPLLAYLNEASFIAIPCCSHNLAGARWRVPTPKQTPKEPKPSAKDFPSSNNKALQEQQAAETGSLKRCSPGSNKMPSAYSALCDYVTDLAREVGYKVEKEMLRIPSTRNACLLGRYEKGLDSAEKVDSALESLSLPGGNVSATYREKRDHVRGILARELNAPMEAIREDWTARAEQIAGKKADGH